MGDQNPTAGEPRRVFLGRETLPLFAAARRLAAERGPDLEELLVGVPGKRAARRLLARLAGELGPRWTPPKILTAGRLADELLEVEGARAERLVRTLAWERALRALGGGLRPLVPTPPASADARGWMRLAEQVRGLFAELAAEGLDFARLVASERVRRIDGESERWRVLARAQEKYVAALEEAGLVDPHLARLAALEAGRVRTDRDVVLVCVVELNAIERGALAALGGRVTALVAAPESEADCFDALGALVPTRWAERELPLTPECWSVTEGPGDQADEALRRIAALGGRYAAEQITIGIADGEVAPEIERRLAERGIAARDAAGTPFTLTAEAKLLAAARELLATRGFAPFGAFVRHPAVEQALARDGATSGFDPPALLDRHLAEHLPGRFDGPWPPRAREREALERLRAGVLALLGDLAQDQPRPLSAWAEPIRALLVRTAGDRPLEGEAARARREALERIGDALADLEALPASLAPAVPAAEAIDRLLRALATETIPPPAAEPGRPTIELLGWLELPLDEAPVCVVTGFCDGLVPETGGGDAWLPDALRRELGLTDDLRRTARDAWATAVLLETREEAFLVTGRRSREGDPLLPSRLAFHVPDDEVPDRLERALAPLATARPAGNDSVAVNRPLPRRDPYHPPERFAISSFKTFLESPYLFYVRHVLGEEAFEHDGRELDPLGFGSLAHAALEVLGREELAAETDPERIAAAFEAALREQARARFGDAPPPAAALQLEQLSWRLSCFATRQAKHAAEGWRVAHVEWQPKTPVTLEVDGEAVELVGRIDRIDVCEDGRWAILDYKSGEKVPEPRKAHGLRERGKPRAWKDLQLPLYALAAQELGLPGLPRLGYGRLGRGREQIDISIEEWFQEEIDGAAEQAREIVRAVRAGEVFEVGRAVPRETSLAALSGKALLVAVGGGEGAEEESEEEAP